MLIKHNKLFYFSISGSDRDTRIEWFDDSTVDRKLLRWPMWNTGKINKFKLLLKTLGEMRSLLVVVDS